MKRHTEAFIGIFFFILVIASLFLTLYPQNIPEGTQPLQEPSTNRALDIIEKMAAKPHFVGSENHGDVASFLESELRKLNLQVETQQGTTLTEWGNLVPARNIMARIKGTGEEKAVLLMAHYDSAPHSASKGASDDAVGIATILEGVRAFLYSHKPHRNDIILLFTDAEETGLNGAALFVTKHPWAQDVGVAINFEARGTAGPSYMLMETPNANGGMVKAFQDANPDYPVASSLMYSIYKLMPNDTDLTVLRERGSIPGYNFAFIDDHFNYHTSQDDIQHLDHRSLSHQLSYVESTLAHFSNADLNKLASDEDSVYFNIPFAFVTYPFGWTFPLLIVSALLFVFVVMIGLGRRSVIMPEIGRGLLLYLGAIAVSGIVTFLLWKLFLVVYPEYGEMLHGFTYNGHAYIIGFLFLSMATSMMFYSRMHSDTARYSYAVGPIFIWLIINTLLAIYLPGGGFFIIPVLAAIVMLGIYCLFEKSNLFVNLLLAIPALFIYVPLIYLLPIGLGLKILFASSILLTLVFGLLLPLIGNWPNKPIWAGACALVSIGFFVYAHLNSGFDDHHRKPNSMVYWLTADTQDAYLATYDESLDTWTEQILGENPSDASELNRNPMFSKYGNTFTYSKKVKPVVFPGPDVEFVRDTVIGRWRHLKMVITPNRKVNRYDIFASEQMSIHRLIANGSTRIGQKGSLHKRLGRKVLSYYAVDNQPLTIELSIPKAQLLDMEILESSFDLLSQPQLEIPQRSSWMMPKPFVLTDAVIIQKKLRATPPTPRQLPVAPASVLTRRDSTSVIVPVPEIPTEFDSIQ